MASPGSSDAAPTRSSSSSTSRDSSNETKEPTCLTIRVLQEITDNFSEERALGQGAYGKVYKGVYDDGEEIAVKLLHNNMKAFEDEQFQHEFDNLMMLNHQNIIRLVGYCYETQRQHMDFEGRIVFGERTYRALCFDYMQMGSLQRHLSDESHGLDWQTRYKIIKGTCEGLKYLHEGFKDPIYHLDLKPDNILLDENMVPKLADFGLSKLFGEEQTRVTQSPIGTIGYMPPEYLFRQVISKKLDVFSLGVVMTKIIAGPSGHTRSDEMPYQEFLDQVHENWRNRLEATCTSRTLLEAYCNQVSICAEMGLSCMEIDRHKRPSIVDITHRLDETETMIEKAISWSMNSVSSMPVNCHKSEDATNLVKIEAYTRSKVIRSAETCDEFPVLLRVMVPPWHRADKIQCAGLDVVAILNITLNSDEWVGYIKQAMVGVIDKLGPNDRLSIVSLEDNGHCFMELTCMSDHGRDLAKLKIKELAAHEKGEYLGAALREGAQILRARGRDESTSRIGCIMLALQGWYREILKQEISPEFPVHVFGLSDYHNCGEMKYIADKSSGSYSFIKRNTDDIEYALMLFVRGLTSVALTYLKITLQAHEDVTISSIESGCYNNLVSSDKQSGTIDLQYMCTGEQKNFMVYLTVPRGKEKLMSIGGSYKSVVVASKELAGLDVIVQRPHWKCLPDELVMHPKVAAELLRIRYMKSILSVYNPGMRAKVLRRLWETTKDSDEGRQVNEEALSDLHKDVAEMHKWYTADPEYIFSWLSCHEWQRATTKGKPSNSSAFQTVGGQQHADGGTSLVKVEGFTRSKAIADDMSNNEFHVLVRVTVAPWRGAQKMPCAAVDVVAVLDVSLNMQGESLERIKQAMMIVIDKLGPGDRLSIVTFQTRPVRLTELNYMSTDSSHGQDAARLKINELKASNGRDTRQTVRATLREGAQILRRRGTEESSSRVGCIMFLSDSQHPENFHMDISPEFPVHTFGLGANHNPKVMKYIADMTLGTYSFVNKEMNNIKDALALFMISLTSVVVTSVLITLRTDFGVVISSIESGGYIHTVKSEGIFNEILSGTINIGHMYAGEQKEFIVNLSPSIGRTELMTITSHYKSLNGCQFSSDTHISVLPSSMPTSCSLGALAIHRDVAAGLIRNRLHDSVSAMLLQQQLTGQGLQKLWDMIKGSDEGRGAPEETLAALCMDVSEMKRDIENPDEYRKSGLPYTLSWLTSHKWQRATTKGTPYNSSAFKTIGQLAHGYTNLVKVEAFTRSEAIPSADLCNELPVLVRVSVAPWQRADKMPRASIDIVAVLDVSGKMKGDNLERMKQAMMIVIDQLSAEDRLSIVSFATYEHRLMKLTYMSDHGRDEASLRINKLVAGGRNNDMGAALREGTEILRWRGPECRSRVGCMMLMSIGDYSEIFKTEIRPEFPVHTFGLGTDHNPWAMKYIADMSSGTYSFVNLDMDKIKGAFKLFITGLKSVAAISINITLMTTQGITLSSIESGGYTHHVKSDGRAGTIEIDNMYASDRKDFIVYLRVAEDKKELMTIGGQYLSHNMEKHLANTDVCVLRPHLQNMPGSLAIHHDVAAELVRIRLQKGISAMLEQGLSNIGLQQLWDAIMDSDEGRGAREETLSDLSVDIIEMKRGIENPEEYRKSGLPNTLSWLSSHNWQRATIKGTP